MGGQRVIAAMHGAGDIRPVDKHAGKHPTGWADKQRGWLRRSTVKDVPGWPLQNTVAPSARVTVMVCVLGTVVAIFTVLSLLSAKTGRQKPQSSASAHSRPVSFFTDVTPFYGHNIGPVHGAAVLKRGRCDAQLRIVPPGRQCAVECDVGNHLPRLDLHGDVKHLIGVGQH